MSLNESVGMTRMESTTRIFSSGLHGAAQGGLRLALALALVLAGACSEKKGGDSGAASSGASADGTAGGAANEASVDPELGRRANVKAPPLPAMPDVVATVNGVPIRRIDFEDALIRKFESQTYAIHTLVWLEAYRDVGKKRGLSVTEKDIDTELERIVAAQGLPGVEGLLKLKCFDLPYLRRQVEFRLWVERLAQEFALAQPGVETKTTDPRVLEAVEAEAEVKMRVHGIPDTAFAVVNGRPVERAEVLKWAVLYAMPNDVAKELEALIANEIDRQEIARAGIDLEGMDVNVGGQVVFKKWDEIVESNRATFRSRGGNWDRSIERAGHTLDSWIANQKRSEGVKVLIQREATEDIVRRYFEENKDMLLLGEQYRVGVLTVDEMFLRKPGEDESDESKAAAKTRIEAAREALDGGMSFDEALKQFGTHKELIAAGGDIGWMHLYQKDNVPIRDAAAKLEVGGTSEPIFYRNVWYIVTLLEKKEAAVADRILKNTEQRTRILQRLATYGQALWRDPVKARSDIKIFVDLPLPYAKG